MAEHRFFRGIPTGGRVDVGGGAALLWFPDDDSHDPHRIGIEHVCSRWPDDQEPDGEFVKIVAPALHPNHTVTMKDGKVTIRASIACPDCGLHGFVTNGQWEAA